MNRRLISLWLSASGLALVPIVACSSNRDRPLMSGDASADAIVFADVKDSSSLPTAQPDPKTCEEAAQQRTYIGCDYWPTITSNIVNSVFDYAVAVANVGEEPANVTVTGNGVTKQSTVAPGSLATIYLPWVPALKGDDEIGLEESVIVRKGAYHLVSDRPVVVYQFNPLEFKAVGGEPGKDWSKCVPAEGVTECYSYSNDASLLLPSTAMTGAYRVMGDFGFSHHPINDFTKQFETNKALIPVSATAVTITATADGTTVELELGSRGLVVGTGGEITTDAGAGDGGADSSADASVDAAKDAAQDAAIDAALGPDDVPHVSAGGKLTLKLDAGDVAQIVARRGEVFDFSGSLVIADKPVQVITSVPCQFHPLDTYACDHVEETVFPAETLGQKYLVNTPTGPAGIQVPHIVRIYGNSDGTALTYKPKKPPGCPDTIAAGQALDCGEVASDFEVSSDKAFGVGMFMLGGARVDPAGGATGYPLGDPSQSFAVAIEQYRQKYVFLAPTDYKTNYVDVVAGEDTKITLDGNDMSTSLKPLTGTTFFVGRIPLGPVNGGVHTLTATRPVGIQVLGYGDNTSFHYPGGLNLAKITAPPR